MYGSLPQHIYSIYYIIMRIPFTAKWNRWTKWKHVWILVESCFNKWGATEDVCRDISDLLSSPLLSTTASVSSEDLHPGLLPRISSLSWSCCQARTLMLPAHRTSHKPITSTIILSSRGRQRQTIEKKRFGGEIDREEGQMTEERWVKRWLRTRGGCGLSHAVIQTKDSYEKIYSWKRDVSNKRQLVMPSTIDAVIY